MKKIIVLTICLIIFSVVIVLTRQSDRPNYLADSYHKYNLDLDNKQETVHFYTKEIEFGDWKTDIFVNDFTKSLLTIDGLLRNGSSYDISTNIRTLVLEISAGGKLINSLLYRYQDGKLIRIPVITDSSNESWDIWSSGGTDFIDTDSDGIKEMLVYHRHYPPQVRRTVEVYKFDGKIFHKYQEYEETTPNIYL